MITFRSIRDAIKGNDFILLFLALTATVIGLVFIFSATRNMSGSYRFIVVQIGAMILGIFVMHAISKIDYEDILSTWKFVAVICLILLLLLIIIGVGKGSTGSTRWIRFGPIGIQPSEIVKIGFIITMSKHLSAVGNQMNYVKNVTLTFLHLLVPALMIAVQPDAGTAICFVFMYFCMVFVAGINWRYVIGAVASASIFSVVAWLLLLRPYQKERILAFLSPESAPSTYGYHVLQSKIAIGSGQNLGKGLFKGIQTQLGILPEKQTDFIFAVIGEEAGFVMCVVTVVVLFALILRCLSIGKKAKTMSGTYICVGVAAMWIFHVFENIGMTIGLMPVTGIPLPFVSYGGSSLVTNFMALGLILSVYSQKRSINF